MKIQKWDVMALIPYELNSKVHDEKQVQKIAKSITQFGWDQPIVVDSDGVIIKGHGRRLAAIQLGLKEVPVLVRDDLDPEQVRAARLADNRVALSDIDTDLLRQELADLNFDLDGIFDKKELDFLVDADLGEFKEEAFVDDLDDEIATQESKTVERLAEVDSRDVKIDKALGFKAVKGKDERYVAAFVALAEEATGLEGADAFVAYIRNLL